MTTFTYEVTQNPVEHRLFADEQEIDRGLWADDNYDGAVAWCELRVSELGTEIGQLRFENDQLKARIAELEAGQ